MFLPVNWYAQVDDTKKTAFVTNLITEHFLGDPRQYQPQQFIKTIPDSFEESEVDWHALITQSLITDEGNYEDHQFLP